MEQRGGDDRTGGGGGGCEEALRLKDWLRKGGPTQHRRHSGTRLPADSGAAGREQVKPPFSLLFRCGIFTFGSA